MYTFANFEFSKIEVGPNASESSCQWVVSGGHMFALLVPLIFAYMHPDHGTYFIAI